MAISRPAAARSPPYRLYPVHLFLMSILVHLNVGIVKIFYLVSLTEFFIVLGAQSMVAVVSYGQGMVLSFKMSHEEAV